ncbi:MAG: hypothetical protein HYY84_19640 [Deltaproteobacteria bacterium]|nr:hypothetical protein [Deltaproteobacteria bacterium]
MLSSSRNRGGASLIARAFALVTVLASASCAATSRSLTLLGESEPIVIEATEQRALLSRRDDPTGLLVKKGGCPVCQW